jgi:hypothetical protein
MSGPQGSDPTQPWPGQQPPQSDPPAWQQPPAPEQPAGDNPAWQQPAYSPQQYPQYPAPQQPYQQPDQYGQQPTAYGPTSYQQPLYGQPQYGQQPQYGAPQYGDQPQYGSPPGAPFGAPPPPPRRGRGGKIALIIIGIVVALCLACGAVLWFTGNSIFDSIKNSSTNAKVGDCLEGDEITGTDTKEVDLKIVKCTDAKAKYKVIGIKDGVSRAESLKQDTTVCDDYIEKGAESVLWQGTNAASGQALCLAPAK